MNSTTRQEEEAAIVASRHVPAGDSPLLSQNVLEVTIGSFLTVGIYANIKRTFTGEYIVALSKKRPLTLARYRTTRVKN